MDPNNFMIAALVVVAAVVLYVLLHKRKVNRVMENNVEVVPLMMQKATQMKVVRLQQATINNTAANDELQKLVTNYKANQIGIKEYNDQLDRMISTLNVEL